MTKLPLVFLFLFPCSYAIAQNGCAGDDHFNDFDFWLGQWNVSSNANGTHAGTNTVTKELNNCLLMESWQGAQGSVGKSMNYFNPLTGLWRQVWVAPGYIIDIKGGLEDRSMALKGTIEYFNDSTYEFRGTWTPNDDGTVRQFFEQFDAEAENWTPWFDGRYEQQSAE